MDRRRFIRTVLIAGAVPVGAAGCGGGGASAASGPRRNPYLVELDELETLSTINALDAIRRLRPRWLQTRGNAGLPIIFRDGARLQRPDALREIIVSEIESMRWLSPADATLKYGTNFPGGAIEVTSRAR